MAERTSSPVASDAHRKTFAVDEEEPWSTDRHHWPRDSSCHEHRDRHEIEFIELRSRERVEDVAGVDQL